MKQIHCCPGMIKVAKCLAKYYFFSTCVWRRRKLGLPAGGLCNIAASFKTCYSIPSLRMLYDVPNVMKTRHNGRSVQDLRWNAEAHGNKSGRCKSEKPTQLRLRASEHLGGVIVSKRRDRRRMPLQKSVIEHCYFTPTQIFHARKMWPMLSY